MKTRFLSLCLAICCVGAGIGVSASLNAKGGPTARFSLPQGLPLRDVQFQDKATRNRPTNKFPDISKLTTAERQALAELPPGCIAELYGLEGKAPQPTRAHSSPPSNIIPNHGQFSAQDLARMRSQRQVRSPARSPRDRSASPANSSGRVVQTSHNQTERVADPNQIRQANRDWQQYAEAYRAANNSGSTASSEPGFSGAQTLPGQNETNFTADLRNRIRTGRGLNRGQQSQDRHGAAPGEFLPSQYPATGFEPHGFAPQEFSSQSAPLEFGSPAGTDVHAMPNPHAGVPSVNPGLNLPAGEDPHLNVFSEGAFPSAMECATCHQQIFDEWASSSHAYASISPMFHVFEEKINKLSQGTIGYFCMRCHAPVATTMGLRRDQAIWDGPRVFREGVTCVACHRVKSVYTKSNGERRIEPGDIYDPVYSGSGGNGVAVASKYSSHFKIKTDRADKSPGQAMHRRSIQFEEISQSAFCVSCHQVAVQPGIKLEVVWDQYRASPAYREGISCQDCHMGKVPGVAEGYSVGPAAVVNDHVVNPERKHSNHIFYGPGYSIAHPGIFPHNKQADRWTVNEWLAFDWRAGWGTDAFEDALADGKFAYSFPPEWQEVDDRYDAREVLDENLKKLEYKKDLRRQLLENGSKLDGPFFAKNPTIGRPLAFNYCVTNTNPGHNMPSGSLGAQPQLWVNVVLIDPAGNRIWETGYLDSNGDLADNHSLDVLAKRVPLDKQLMNFQTKFLTTNVKGTDREMYLPINVDIDQLPFLRPAAQPVSVLNHPPFIRMEGHSLPPLGSRKVKYVVPANLIQMPGTYRLTARMRSRAEPIYFMRFCDATPEMERMMNEWIADVHVQSVTFEVH